MTTGLTTFLFGYNVEAALYPWREAIESAMPISDKVIFCECYSDKDNTWEEARKLAREYRGRLQLLRHPWGNHHTVQSFIANHCLRYIQTPWALKLDADEAIHHDSYQEFLKELRWMEEKGYTGGRPYYWHFVQNFQTTFEFIYRRKLTVVYLPDGWHFATGEHQDACEFFYGRQDRVVNLSLTIHHVGKVAEGRAKEAIEKEYKFQTQLYQSIGFPDPLVVEQYEKNGKADYEKIFYVAKSKGEFKPFTGTHPRALLPYIERMKKREAELKHAA